jgi:hypothetical protein
MTTKSFRRLLASAALILAATPAVADGPFRFYPLTPCRLIDTRQPAQAPAMTADTTGATRSFKIRGTCGLPTDARAAALNVTIATPTKKGHIRVFPSDVALPNISTLNFAGGENAVANGAIIPMPVDTGSVTDMSIFLYMVETGTGHMVVDVTGYFR